MSLAVLLAENHILVHAGLYFLIEMRIVETQHQAVCPRLVHKTDFPDNRFVMELVVEPLHVVYLVTVGIFGNTILTELGDIVINIIIIVREILESVYLIRQPVPESLPEVNIRLMRIERTVGIRSVQVPFTAMLVGHNVDDSSQSIRAEPYGNYTFIYFDALGKVHGDVIDVKGRTRSFLRYSVDKDFHVLARKAVKHQLHIRTYPTRLAQLQSWKLHQGFTQAFG